MAGTVIVGRYHDRVTVAVTRDGERILDAALVDPQPISGADVQYMHSVTLARLDEAAGSTATLVQVDPHYTFHTAERGRPTIARFAAAAWNADGLAPVHPISASFATCDTDLPRIRFVIDPEIPVIRGTRRIR